MTELEYLEQIAAANHDIYTLMICSVSFFIITTGLITGWFISGR